MAEEEDSPAAPPAAVLRGALQVFPGCSSAGAVRRLQYVGGSPTATGEALLTFGGQPEDKPDCLSLLPLPSQVSSPSSVRHGAHGLPHSVVSSSPILYLDRKRLCSKHMSSCGCANGAHSAMLDPHTTDEHSRNLTSRNMVMVRNQSCLIQQHRPRSFTTSDAK